MIGRTISHYEILARLGKGGMGEVYLAEDSTLDRKVALKVLPPELATNPDRRRRFEREAKAIAALNHANIVTIFSVEQAEGLHFLTLEWVDGETLAEILTAGPLEMERLLEIATPLADALRAAHQRGITHRDLKPSNIMLGADGTLKVLDFGLATQEEPAAGSDENVARHSRSKTLTEIAEVAGTIPYMSPEQLLGKPADPRTDLYSLGVILYEMTAGRRPFAAANPVELAASILRDPPPALAALRPGLPRALEDLVSRCLEKEPDHRYPTARVLLEELEALKGDLGSYIAGVGSDPSSDTGSTTSDFLTPVGRGRPSIAVLAFNDLSPRKDQDYFCEGLAEELINGLTQIEDLRVVARTSAFSFKAEEHDPQEIARRLKVDAILKGSVRKARDRLRITAQLIDGGDGSNLWSERFDRDMDDVFAIQDEITSAIVDQLKIELLGEQKTDLIRRHTTDLEAYHLYLKGRHFWNKRTPAELASSIRLFQQAIDRDPGYALAHAGVADSYTILGYYSAMEPRDAFPKAKAAAAKALAFDDSLAQAHSSLAFAQVLYDWDWRQAERGFRRTFELNPGYATGHHWYAEYLVWTGRGEEAVAEAHKALEIDPLSLIINTLIGWVHYYTRRNDRAIRKLRKTLELDPAFAPANFWLALAYSQAGQLDEARTAIERALESAGESPMMLAARASLHAAAGEAAAAEGILGALLRTAAETYVPPYYIAAIYSALDDWPRTCEWLEKARRARDNWLVFLKVDPIWDRVRAEPEFAALARDVGFE